MSSYYRCQAALQMIKCSGKNSMKKNVSYKKKTCNYCLARKWFLVDLKRSYRLSNLLYGEPTPRATHATEGPKLPRRLCLETTSLASQHERGCTLHKKPYGGLFFHDSESSSSTGHSRINKQEKINTCFLRASSLLFCSSSFRASIKCCLSSSLYERRFSCKG